MLKWLPTVAKALTAIIAVVIGAIAAGQLDVAPWVEVLLTSVAAGLAVWAVPNKATG